MIKRFLSNLIKNKLLQSFETDMVEVINESQLHSKGLNTHFKVVVVSDEFVNKGLVVRQRMVNKALNEFWDQGVHSISIHAKTMEEAKEKVLKSPFCMNKN